MAEPGVISEYLERIARELDFDPSLSQRVRREVEDHLWEAVAAHRSGDALEAERCAVTKFGDPRVIAAEFAVLSLAKQAQRVGMAALVVIGAVFIVMKARLTWYVATKWPTDRMGAVGDLVVSVDRYAFWLSVFLAMAGWIYIGSRRVPAGLTLEYRTQLRRFLLLCLTAAGALIASVVSDGVLTSLRLVGTPWSLDVFVPLASMAIEVVCAGGLVVSIRGITRRTASTSRGSGME